MYLRLLSKTLQIMNITAILLLAACLQATAMEGYSQKITISQKNVSLKTVFKTIEQQSDYQFFYKDKLLKQAKNVNVNVTNASIDEVLSVCLQGQSLTYSIIDKIIVIKKGAPVVSHAPPPAPAPATIEIRGVIVSDSTGLPLAGVSVKLKGTDKGTFTDLNGNFVLQAPDAGAVLEISSIGYDSREVTVTKEGTIRIGLKVAAAKIAEVVIVGYATQEKRKLTSAVVTVSGEELTKRVATDPTSLLQGQLPGLSVVQNSAEPGNEDIQLRIRGVGTFSGAGTNPLIIVDGLPGNLSVINPNDIESATVLKDAASAAIYGSRGANGVIVIKTKKGRGGVFALTYNVNIGLSTPTRLPHLVTNSAEYMALSNEAETNSGNAPLYTQAEIDLYQNATDRVKYPNHNWLNDMFKTATVQNHYLNLSGGKEGTTYSLGLGYTDQPGTMLGFSYKKYTVDLGLSSRVNKRVTVGTNLQFRYGNRVYPEDNSTDLYIAALAQSPLYPARTTTGLWIYKAYSQELGNKNPVLTATMAQTNNPDYYGQGNLSLDVDILKGLKWENRAGASFDVDKSKTFIPTVPTYYYSDLSFAGDFNPGTSLGLTVGENDEIHTTIYSQLNYRRSFGLHNLTVLGGAQEEVDNYSQLNASRIGFPTNDLTELDAGSASGQTNEGTSSEWAIQSFYGNVNYDYDDKYLFGSSVRYDGTSRLPSASRWGLFYSFSGAWRLSSEAFLKNVSWLNDLKVRGSWGELGNQNIGTYPYQSILSQNSYAFAGTVSTGFTANTLVDPNLTWETTRVTDLGIDLATLKNRLSFSADWFDKYTFNILRGSQVPLWLGLNAPTVNNGAVSNKGFEFSLRYQDHIGRGFNYYGVANFQLYRNKLVSFGTPEYGGPDGQTIMENGKPINSFYLYVMDGIFQSQDEINKSPDQSSLGGVPTPGDIKYKDINGDGKVDVNDRTVVPGQYPNFEYSYTMGASYKGFDASVQLYGSQGNKLYLYKWGTDPFAQGAPPTTDWLNRWTPAHPSTTMPKIYMGYYGYPKITGVQSTFHLYNASFMRIKNVMLGYTIPTRLLRSTKSLRIYFSVDNAALFTPLKQGTDPERLDINNKPDAWYGFANYPQNRTFTFGASVQF
ncbi:TonB-dependent receptor [Dinghuibacter silviterrae]|uniref:TonB-linked SusC/RagA family outer membrane protein n=1 Tax=Dinghuibacter silviterrae TaxID=1539049 RepID=A0A4R8DS96_9BACT|nr:TonB-dependent receptor [Dinghuibacter silviterrae]TDX00899.1 TonB-linked SusC/RagA family outer membrane protein [Dinghuibacter silviterrae]